MPGLLRSVPLLAQSDRADCLPACVEMVLTSFGHRVERDWLKQVLETTPLGTPGFKLLNLRAYNYDVVYAAAMNERPLTEALSNNVPPIALVYTTGLSYWTRETAHAVVVVEFGDRVAVVANLHRGPPLVAAIFEVVGDRPWQIRADHLPGDVHPPLGQVGDQGEGFLA